MHTIHNFYKWVVIFPCGEKSQILRDLESCVLGQQQVLDRKCFRKALHKKNHFI